MDTFLHIYVVNMKCLFEKTKINQKESGEKTISKTGHLVRMIKMPLRAVVVAQSVERSLPFPEVCGSNPVIGSIYCQMY